MWCCTQDERESPKGQQKMPTLLAWSTGPNLPMLLETQLNFGKANFARAVLAFKICQDCCKCSYSQKDIMITHLFLKTKADALPPRRECNHKIELTGPPPTKGGIYRLSDPEDQVLQDYISENVEKDFIRPSKSPVGAGILFVPKHNGGL